MLANLGYQVHIAANGREALTALTHYNYDLVLMDCQMPGMDGFEATRIIRAQEALANPPSRLPIIAFTAHALESDRESCLAAGMDDFLSKPFNQEQLARILEKWLPRKSAPQSLEVIQPEVPASPPYPSTGETAPNPASAPAPPSHPVALSSSLEVTALEAIRSLDKDGGTDLLTRVIRTYLGETQRLLECLNRAVTAQDAGAAQRAAHSMKSSSAYIGALKLSALLKKMETLAGLRSLDQTPALMAAVAEEYENVHTELLAELQGLENPVS